MSHLMMHLPFNLFSDPQHRHLNIATGFVSRRVLVVLTAALLISPWAFARQAQSATPPVSGTDSSSANLPQLQQMIDKGHTAEALKGLDALAVQKPVPPGVRRLQGNAYYATDRFADADSAFAAAL